jgi:hypothetical protein
VLQGFSLYQAEKRAARKKSILRILYNSFDAVNVNALAQFGDRMARVQKRVVWSRFFCLHSWAKSPLPKQCWVVLIFFKEPLVLGI